MNGAAENHAKCMNERAEEVGRAGIGGAAMAALGRQVSVFPPADKTASSPDSLITR